MKRFNESITFKDGCYYSSWPWKEDVGKLDCNFGLCMGRLKTSLERLQKDHKLLRAYEKTFDAQLKTGIIEDVTNTQPEGLEKLYKNHGGKTKAVDVKMLNGHL
uniref:Uncharacterized protein n=1 Tax=Parascaris univalens TaxID=6257 RepID=A0A915A8C6_PARUN